MESIRKNVLFNFEWVSRGEMYGGFSKSTKPFPWKSLRKQPFLLTIRKVLANRESSHEWGKSLIIFHESFIAGPSVIRSNFTFAVSFRDFSETLCNFLNKKWIIGNVIFLWNKLHSIRLNVFILFKFKFIFGTTYAEFQLWIKIIRKWQHA